MPGSCFLLKITLCGTGQKGQTNGSLKDATFNLPTLLAFVPEKGLVVFDAGTNRLRLIDLQEGKVTTLLTLPGDVVDPAQTIYSLAYLPKEHSLYFTQPTLHALTRLDLSSGKTQSFHADIHFPNPGALAVLGDKLCVADFHLPSVYQVDSLSKSPGGDLVPAVTELGQGQNILSLASSGKKLYALQRGTNPWVQVFPEAGPVKLMSQSGAFLENHGEELDHLFNFNAGAGFLAEPGQEGSFFFALPHLNAVLNLKDYGFDANKDAEKENKDGLMDFDYPTAKPAHAFRILELGDSRLFFEPEKEWEKKWPWGYNRMVTSPKKLELFLNTLASLNNETTRYQVLHSGEKRATPVQLRSYYVAPQLAEKYDVDLVLILIPLDFVTPFYQEHPFGKEGLPLLTIDHEFLLEPLAQRLKEDHDSVLSDLYQRCVDLHLVQKGSEIDSDLPPLVTDDNIRKDLLEMAARPLRLLVAKMSGMKTKEGHPVRLGLVFYPNGPSGSDDILPTETYRNFWKEASKQAGIPFYDLTEAVVSTRLSYYPISEIYGFRHFTDEGHSYFAFLLTNLLMKEKLIPFGVNSGPNGK